MYPEDEIDTLQNDDTMDAENVSMENFDNQAKEPLVEDTQLDLEVYASNFRGTSKIQRLLYIADHCPSLRVEALKLALDYIQQATNNTVLYQEIHEKLKETFKVKEGHFMRHFLNQIRPIPQGNSEREINTLIEEAYAFFNIPTYDANWVDNTTKRAALKLEKLDTDLKNYRNNFIKESIRRGHCELGEHYVLCGDLANALKCFSRPRDYCTSPKHVVNMCLNVMRVSVYLQNWTHVLSYATRAESTIASELTSSPASNASQNNFAEKRDTKPPSKSSLTSGASSRPSTNTAAANNLESSVQTTEAENATSERQRPIKPPPGGNPKTASSAASSSSNTNFYSVAASKINCLAGLAEFCRGQYGEAASRLCKVNADHVTPNPTGPPPTIAIHPYPNASNDFSTPGHLQSPPSVLQQQQQPLITRFIKRSPNPPSSSTAAMMESCDDISDATPASLPKSAGSNSTPNPVLTNTVNAIAFEDPFLLAPGNVAWYAGLAALSSFDRAHLKKQIISNSSPFKLFLELEPCLRELLNAFHESKYAICLRYLDDVKDQLLLDMYAAPLVSSLYEQIQKRAMIQYVTPFTRADLNLMSVAFNFIPLASLEAQVGELIESGAIDARIDSFNKILLARDKDDRKLSFIKALQNGADFKRKMAALILRAAAIDANVIVKPNRHTTNNISSGRTHSPHRSSAQAQHNLGPSSSSHLRE